MPAPSNPADFATFIGKPLNKAEDYFKNCMENGVPCIFGDDVPDEGNETNTIRADLIRFFARGGDETRHIQDNIIAVQGVYVSGRLDLENVLSEHALVLTKCYFDSPVVMINAKFRVVKLDGSHLTQGFLGGGMQVDKDMYMDDGFIAEGEVNLLGANIGGGLYCDGGEFKNQGNYAFAADRLKVGENLYMRNGFSAKGEVRLLSARINGDLMCDNGKFDNKQGKSLAADMARIDGKVFMQNIFAEGEVRFLNARIGSDFCCDGGAFINNGKIALAVDGINVGNILSLQDGFQSEGKVWLVAANIGRDFYCSGGNFKDALVADGIKVGGNVFMRDNFCADDVVQFPGAHIGGDCVCEGVFNKGFNATSAQIKKYLVWDTAGGQGKVNLAHATARILFDDDAHLAKFDYDLYGFSYEKFDNPWNVKSRVDWLRRRPKDTEFSPQPFEQAAKVLFAMGHRGDAREVLFAMEKCRTEEEYTKPSGWRKHWGIFWRRAWEKATGYNHLVRQMLKTSAGIIVASALLFCAADYGGYIVPHQPVVLASPQYKNAITGIPQTEVERKCSEAPRPTGVVECLFSNYPRFNPLSFSVDIFVPLFSLRQEGYWYPQADANALSVIRWLVLGWYWFVVIAGWVLTSIFALTITGIWQRQQAGG